MIFDITVTLEDATVTATATNDIAVTVTLDDEVINPEETFCERVDACLDIPTADGNYVLKILNGVKSWIAATAGATWGSITGTLSAQTDLQNALNAKEDTITAGTTSQYWRGDKSWQTLNKSAVGLGNVDNTSDANKPVSNATQLALDQESITRLNADTALSADIITEASARSSGDATLLAMINGLNIPTFSPTAGNTIAEIIDDFAYVTPLGGSSTSSSYAMSHTGSNVLSITNLVSSLGNQIGVVQCQYNATGDNVWSMIRVVALGQGEVCLGCYMRRPNDSGAANQSNLRFGLRLGAGDGTDGVFFKLNEATNGNQWQCITRASSVSTTSNTSVTTAKSSWVRLFIVINAAGTEAKFYINGTLVATHNTNMPAAGTALTGILNMERTVVSSVITWLIDYFYIKQTFTTPR